MIKYANISNIQNRDHMGYISGRSSGWSNDAPFPSGAEALRVTPRVARLGAVFLLGNDDGL